MKRHFILLLALALVATACGGSGDVVATVNGRDVTVDDVAGLRPDSGSTDSETFRTELRNTIVEFVVIDVAESEFGITYTDEEVEARKQEIIAEIEEPGTITYEEFLEQQEFSDERITRIAHQQLVSQAIEERLVADEDPVTDEEVQARYDTLLIQLTEVCASHILVPTEEEANDALARIEGGESFADVAADVSTDGSAVEGGDLGCAAPSGYVAPFAEATMSAEIDVPTEPVQSEFGWHLILVNERTTTPLEEIEEDLREGMEAERSGALVQEWLLDTVTSADVTIDPDYGIWAVAPTPNVLPPQ